MKGIHEVCGEDLSEDEFLQKSYQQLQTLGINPKKMLAGLKRDRDRTPSTCHCCHDSSVGG